MSNTAHSCQCVQCFFVSKQSVSVCPNNPILWLPGLGRCKVNTVAFSVEVLQDSPLSSCVHIYIWHVNLDCELILYYHC